MSRRLLSLLLLLVPALAGISAPAAERPRVIVTSDAEIDDQCSLVRFLLYANEWDIEGLITTSSQYRWQGHKWPGDNWIDPYLAAYAEVHPNLVKHDPAYPSPAALRAIAVMGNAAAEGDLAAPSPGSELIVKALLDASDPRPIWLQAWGGANTIARALKTIEEQHPERMAEVAAKCRLFLIWEQDDTYQRYLRPVWGKYGILTIISDQFEAIAYRWKQAQPESLHRYFEGAWMRANILRNRGPLTALYHAHENGDFRSEGDSPAFLHTIPTGLRSLESPDWGGWGGRYVRVRENTWLDPVSVPGYAYPEGRWWGENGWGRASLRPTSTSTAEQRARYFEPMTRWTAALQNDFAARAAWCVLPYADANHPPVVALTHARDLQAAAGATVALSARGSSDPDGDTLRYRWWRDADADTAAGEAGLRGADGIEASLVIPADALPGQTVHVICEVTDEGTPALTRYQRVVVTVVAAPDASVTATGTASPVAIPPMTAHFPLNRSGNPVVPDTRGELSGQLIHRDPALAWIPGIEREALRLDGRSARVVIPHHAAVDFGDESFSVTFWLRWPRGLLPGHQRLLTKGDYDPAYPGETGRRYELYVSSGELCFTIDDNMVPSRLRVALAPFVTGEWVHVAVVRDRSAGRLRLYANGNPLPTSNPGNPGGDGTDLTGALSNPRPLFVGDSSREDAPFHGDLDDLRVFREALTPGQVAAIARRAPLVEKAEAAASAQAARPVERPAPLPPLAAHFPLTEGEGGSVRDQVGDVRGELRNADLEAAWTSSDRGLALRFDGVDDHVEVPAAPGFDFADESFSVAFHVRWTKGAAPRHEHLLAKGDYDRAVPGETGRRWEINLTPGGLNFIVDDDVTKSQIEVPAAAVTSGQWAHVVAVRDRREKRLKVYVNGALQTSNQPADTLRDGIDRTGSIANPRGLVIGASGRRDNALPGELADLRIYREALSAAQVSAVAALRRTAASNPAESGRASQ